MSTYHIYEKASKTPTQTYPAGLEDESSSTSIMCVCVRLCVCRVVLLERPWYVRAAKTLASLCAL